MLFWLRFPFVRFVIFLLTGILTYRYLPEISVPPFIIFLFTVIFYLIIWLINKRYPFKIFELWSGIIAMICLWSAGYLVATLHDSRKSPGHILHRNDRIKAYSALVEEVENHDSLFTRARVRLVMAYGENWRRHHGQIMLTVRNTEGKIPFHEGDLLAIKGSPLPVQHPLNPGEFDYAGYLERRDIYHQQFIDPRAFKILRNEAVHSISMRARIMNEKLRKSMSSCIPDSYSLALLSALVLGYKKTLDTSAIQDFAGSGVSHILAVSGLHVGIIYVMLLFIFRHLFRKPKMAWLSTVIIILMLSAYAILTGLSPSVLRSVVMFSFIEAGRRIGRKGLTLNTLAVSAFFILAWQPQFIYSAGFQLSYLAICGIIFFQPIIYRIFIFKNNIADYLWQIISVSVAAQITTFPVTAAYFHAFPVYFIPANMIAIPITFILLILGITILVLHPVPWVGFLLGYIASWISHILKFVLFHLSRLPFSRIDDIRMSPVMVMLSFLTLLLIILLINSKKITYLLAVICMSLIMISVQWFEKAGLYRQSKIVFYSCKKGPLIEFITGHEGLIYFDGQAGDREYDLRKIIHNNCQNGGHPVTWPSEGRPFIPPNRSCDGMSAIYWNGLLIILITEPGHLSSFNGSPPLKADVILLTRRSGGHIDQIFRKFSADLWIIDGSIQGNNLESMVRKMQVAGIHYYSIPTSGALTLIR